MRRIVMLVCAALLTGPVGRAAAQTDDALETLFLFRQCPLNVELEAVYERPAKVDGRSRFLTLTVKDRPQAFVQCLVADGAVSCEASAFYGGTLERKDPLPAQSVAALQRLGFTAEPGGRNLSYRRALNGKPDFDAIAVLMLTALYDAYGVRADTELETYAPFAGSMDTACRR